MKKLALRWIPHGSPSEWHPPTSEAASWNRDWSVPKHGEVLEEWLGRRWTTPVTLSTDKDGIARWRGFPGYYELKQEGSVQAMGFKASDTQAATSVKLR